MHCSLWVIPFSSIHSECKFVLRLLLDVHIDQRCISARTSSREVNIIKRWGVYDVINKSMTLQSNHYSTISDAINKLNFHQALHDENCFPFVCKVRCSTATNVSTQTLVNNYSCLWPLQCTFHAIVTWQGLGHLHELDKVSTPWSINLMY